jgi:alpha-N-arabinofuranosidase
MRRLLLASLLAGLLSTAAAQDATHLTVDASKPGSTIDRHIFGQFAENLGYGNHEGIWVGPDSPIPNTRGIRTDVVNALRKLKVPDVRWPGGCYADQYHWRWGVGPRDKRTATINGAWGNVIEPNDFGTDEFMDFIQQIGSEAYISVNVGSGTVKEAADWLDYMTDAQPTKLAKERAANGHAEPYEVAMMGIGNEAWDCGGAMTPEFYTDQMKLYARFVRNMNPAQAPGKTPGAPDHHMLNIAVGPGTADTTWTEAIMKAWKQHTWSWDIDGMSLHWYTTPSWPPSAPSTDFGVDQYAKMLHLTLAMNDLLHKQEAVMDQYDPQKKVALVVDEWGDWLGPLPGTNPSFLIQQNSLRDAVLASLNLNIFARHADRVRMANIAQMVNVLQAMILTDKAKMVLTPTYYVFRMYIPFQDSTFVPVTFDAGTYTQGDVTLPRIDAIAAKDKTGHLVLELTNLDPESPVTIDAAINGFPVRAASGETLTAPQVDSINTFDKPDLVMPKAVFANVQNGALTITLAPKSVSVLTLQK